MHRQRLYAYLWARTGSREDALDLLQEVFVRAWRNETTLAALSEDGRRYWLFSVARRLGIDHHRHGLVVGRVVYEADPVAPEGNGPDDRVESAEAVRLLDGAIRALPDPLREVLVMTVVGEMTSPEIGRVLGLPAGTVRYRLMRARHLLRQALGEAKP